MIFRSPHEALTIPETSLAEYVLQRAPEFGNKPALIDGPHGRSITYKELVPTIRKLAAGFARHGLRKGDVLAIYSLNSPEYALAFLAVATLGGATTMVPPLFTDTEVQTQLRDSGANYLLTIPKLLDKANQAVQDSKIRQIFVIGEAEGAVSFTSLLENDDPLPEITIDSRSDLVALPIPARHYRLSQGSDADALQPGFHVVSASCRRGPHRERHDRLCGADVPPLWLARGCKSGTQQGATIVILPRYDRGEFLRTLEHYRVAVAPLVPPLVLELSRVPEVDHYDLSKLRLDSLWCSSARR